MTGSPDSPTDDARHDQVARTQALPRRADDTPTQTFPAQQPTVPAMIPSGTELSIPPQQAPHKKRWPKVAAIVAIIAIVAGIGGMVYSHKHSEALVNCRTAVSEFSDARKELLATSDESPMMQKLIRDVLGVDDILNAVADAATAAEGTVSDQGCATNATITQLTLVANTLNSATDSLRSSIAQINAKSS